MEPTLDDAPDDCAVDRRVRLTDRRLAIIEILRHRSAPVSVSELADELAGREGCRTEAHARRIEIRLHHADLPLLEDAGLLVYDVGHRTVSTKPTYRPDRRTV